MAAGLVGLAGVAAEAPSVDLKVGEMRHGFAVRAVEELPDIRARFVRMTYVKNGADLVWLDRADANKTFCIAFRTPPEDDTGVAHVLEHSVLCGSGRYPVKEPFVELLKSSMATFLNASTWSDRTGYPVATRNAKDFHNLVDVYLDAVFDPNCVRDDWVLKQEGWHYELSDDLTLSRTGVVYSEMKGSFSSPDTVAFHELKRLLFPDNCYGFVSGGDPASIPNLTFEGFSRFYRKHYHPSNARIFLDGAIDLDATLAQLDGALKRFGKAEVKSDIQPQAPVSNRRIVRYESEEEENRVMLKDGWVFSSCTDREQELVFDVLSDYFTDSNEAPLTRAILVAGLGEDVQMGVTSLGQLVASVTVRNTSRDRAEACRKLVRETFMRACERGLDRARLRAILEKHEFRALEQDSGSYPKGLELLGLTFEAWTYGADPAEAFRLRPLFASVREKLEDGLFERSLRRFVLENEHHAELTLVPSKTLAAERAQFESDRMTARLATFSSEERANIAAEAKALKDRQSRPDEPANLARLPRLKVSDVAPEGTEIPCTVGDRDGVTVLRPDVGVEGLFYLRLGFSMEGLTDAELQDAKFLAALLGELATERYAASELKTELSGKLGSFDADAVSCLRGAWLTVSVSALDRRQEDLLQLVPEVLLRTTYADRKAIADIRAQLLERARRYLRARGDTFARYRTVRGYSETARKAELLEGLSQLRRLEGPCGTDLAELAGKLFVRERLTVGLSANASDAIVDRVIAAFPSVGAAPKAVPSAAREMPMAYEGVEIPAPVGFSALGGHLPEGVEQTGSHLVAARIISLDHLWNTVRVKGGAYGTGLTVSASGNVTFTSYRDPHPFAAKESFLSAGAALKAFVESGKSFEKYQVASVGRLEPSLSPRAEMDEAMERHYAGKTAADRQRIRREILATTAADLLKAAEDISRAAATANHCVVGGREILLH